MNLQVLCMDITDDPQWKEVLTLLSQNPDKARQVGLGELPVAGRRPARPDQALRLEIPDLGQRQIRELLPEPLEDIADAEADVVGRPSSGHHRGSGPGSVEENQFEPPNLEHVAVVEPARLDSVAV